MSRPDFELSRLRLSPDIVSRRIAGEHILVPVRNGAAHIDYLFTANEVGSVVFDLLDGRHDGIEIARHLASEFEVTEEQARLDLLDFLNQIYDAGLAAPVEEAP